MNNLTDAFDDSDDYTHLTELDWAEYEFATIEYDFRIHPIAAERIRHLFKRLHDKRD